MTLQHLEDRIKSLEKEVLQLREELRVEKCERLGINPHKLKKSHDLSRRK